MDIIVRLCYEYIQSKTAKTRNLYQKIDPAILQFLNTIGCRHQMVLICFMYKMAFDDMVDYKYYYDNYMYNNIKVG